jgi:3,4-dihydroxy 2-butanone 4-phosphate synthase/GTP cyclohydrolase II
MALNSIREIIDDLRAGHMVIIMDDEERENEGDFVMAAARIAPEHINFMARHGRGLICLTLEKERCERLRLPLMVHETYYSRRTNFTVSIEAAEGITTGISAADRATTVQRAVAADARPSDLVQPGHIFPLMAQPGGVLVRAGHTEAGCDLARLAGLLPAAVIVEILNDDGTMARRPDLERIAAEHGLKIGTIADLIRFRLENEKTIQRIACAPVPTAHGPRQLYTYRDGVTGDVHLALVHGQPQPDEPILVRVHVHNPLLDLTGIHLGGWSLTAALAEIGTAAAGVVVILRNPIASAELESQATALAAALAVPPAASGGGPPPRPSADLYEIGLGAQILADLGVRKMRVMSSPRRLHALSGFGLEIVEYVLPTAAP